MTEVRCEGHVRARGGGGGEGKFTFVVGWNRIKQLKRPLEMVGV